MTAVPASRQNCCIYHLLFPECARRKNDPRARACWRLRRLRGSRAPRCPHVMPCCPRLRATCPPHASHPLQHLCAVKSAPGAGLETPVYLVWPQAPLHGCCMDVAWMLHGCCMNVAWMLHGCCMDVAGMPAGTRMRRGEGEAQGQQQHPRAGLYLPPSSPLSPTTPSPSPISAREHAVTSGARAGFVRGSLSARAPPNLHNSQRKNSQRGGRPRWP